jgi:integrase
MPPEKSRKRRGRGEGSISQRADGLWVASVSLGIGPDGKRRRPTVYGKTKQEVLDKLREIDPAKLPASGKAVTVGQFLASWLESVRASVEPTTWDGYDQHIRLHIGPRIGSCKLAGLTALHVQDMLAGLIRDGVSPALTRKVGVTVRTALNAAVRMLLVPVNVALAAPLSKVPRFEPKVFTPEQVREFLKAAEADRFGALYVLAIDSGCRQGELLALRWTDLDTATGPLAVTKSLANRQGKVWVKETKREKSRRSVVLSFSLEKLKEHRERMAAEGWDTEAGLMFPSTTGGYVCKGNLHTRYFGPTLKRAKLPAIRFHDLRHCCASLLLAAGVDCKVVSERLGHASPAFTATVY